MYKRIDFSKLEGLATYQDTLDFLQVSYREAISAIAKAFGSKVIVTGITDQGTTFSDGWVVIDGELMPFAGGLKTDRIVVEEISDTEIFNDGSIQTVYYTKRAKLGITGGFAFSDFVRVDTLSAISLGLKNLITAHNNLQAAFNTHTHSWNDITNKPSTFYPSGHRHDWNDIDNKPVNKILYAATHNCNRPGGKQDYIQTVYIPYTPVEYVVVGSLVGVSDYSYWQNDNNAFFTVRDKTSSYFSLVLQSVGKENMDLYFDYALISK
ncbi:MULTISPECIES: hypothetical protein [Niastella]|uniref:Uncharacterized protein n=1 Tax=Niastella soli TaxID=2821487 RepID=A0ABS3YTQ8_9BACT|nr:hypothetical protein [Niastella soli]MBO9200591.1 hypothetical protein [Niastella soli]